MQWTAKHLYNALTAERGIVCEAGLAYGPHARHKLDVYRAAGGPAAATAPVVIFYHGGGWTDGDRATYRFVGTALAARGITTVVPDYRLYPEVAFPVFVDDAALAFAWVAGHLATHGQPVLIAGHSAGAHIAALLGFDRSYLQRLAPDASPPAAVIGLAGPYAFDPTTWPTTRQIFATAAGQPDRARPVTFVRRGAPPALLLHGSADSTVKRFNTVDLAAALRGVGSRVDVVEYAGIGHVGLVLALSQPFRWRAAVLDDIVRFVGSIAAPAAGEMPGVLAAR
jgi:acetyl esterase/lipase